MAAEERAPINFGSIDGERLVEKPIFKMRVATEPMIKSLKTKEVEAKVWNSEHLMSSVVAKSGFTNFKLSEGKLPSIKDKLARRGSQSAASLPSPGDSTDFRGRFGMKRADHYFQLLMKAKQKTEEANRKLAEADDLKRAEGAARQAFRKLVGADDRSEATTDSEADDMDEDYGPLTAFDGQMKIDIDFVVVVPHRDEDKEDVFIYPTHPEVLQASVGGPGDPEMAPFETPPQSASSGESTPMDFSDEMESLKVELKKAGQLEEPKGIAQRDNVRAAVEPGQGVSSEKTMPNIWDNPYPEWTLETGGSMYFIPDAERYAWCPSLPPPPPPSMLGRRRLRLKPRLPLALSNHRYKDEHPNIFPPDPFSPSKGHYASWEKKVLTYDLYKSCVESLSQMPPQEFAKDAYKHKLQFGSHMEKALRKSRAWRNWRSRENQRLKDEEAQKQQERENEAKRQLEKEKKQKAAEEALRLAEDDDDW